MLFTEDLILIIAGYDTFDVQADWTYMPTAGNTLPIRLTRQTLRIRPAPALTLLFPRATSSPSKNTGESPTGSLERIDNAIVKRQRARPPRSHAEQTGKYRDQSFHPGRNRGKPPNPAFLMLTWRSEMTQFVRNQILTQSAVAMLGQANSYPHMLMNLMNGWEFTFTFFSRE